MRGKYQIIGLIFGIFFCLVFCFFQKEDHTPHKRLLTAGNHLLGWTELHEAAMNTEVQQPAFLKKERIYPFCFLKQDKFHFMEKLTNSWISQPAGEIHLEKKGFYKQQKKFAVWQCWAQEMRANSIWIREMKTKAMAGREGCRQDNHWQEHFPQSCLSSALLQNQFITKSTDIAEREFARYFPRSFMFPKIMEHEGKSWEENMVYVD